MSIIKNRYEFVCYFDVRNGNPNGDPDSLNMPRIFPDTGNGMISDACIKRKIRDYVEKVHSGESGYRIYLKSGTVIADTNKEAFTTLGKKLDKKADETVTDWLCENFFDMRAFGGVTATSDTNPGCVRGCVQIPFAESTHPISPLNVTITRCCVTNEKDKDDGKRSTFGNKYIVPYAMYRLEGFISPFDAEKTKFSTDDLSVLFDALLNMFELDHSASRGKMATRKLVVFEHDTPKGEVSSEELFRRVRCKTKNQLKHEETMVSDRVILTADFAPTCYEDCCIICDTENVPASVKMTILR